MSVWGRNFASGSSMAVYDEIMVPRLFEPWANVLLDRLAITSGERVADVACGPGSVARLAAARVGPAGTVAGCDLSAAMIAIARDKPSPDGSARIEYHEAPADALPLASGAFDALTCQQGLQFFPDRPAAAREMRRVLRDSGRAGIAVWTDVDRSPGFRALADSIGEVLGPEAAGAYRSGPWGFPDPAALEELLAGAGFGSVSVERHTVEVAFEGGAGQIVATLAVTPLGAGLDAATVERIREALEARLGSGPIELPTESSIALASA